MSYFSDYFPLLDEDKIKTKAKTYQVYQAIKKSENEVNLRRLIDAAVKSGSDIFKTPSNKSINVYREAGRVLRNEERGRKTPKGTKAGKDLKSADSRLVRLVNKVARVQRKKVKGYPLNGVVYLGAI
jgi:uncharacterized protein YaaR (DUF327 family)